MNKVEERKYVYRRVNNDEKGKICDSLSYADVVAIAV